MAKQEVVFPMIVRDRQDKDYLQVFFSIEDAQLGLEPPDVKNLEYEAWNIAGFPLVLAVSDSGPTDRWLGIELLGATPSLHDQEVRSLLVQFARSRELEPTTESHGNSSDLANWIKQETERRVQRLRQ